MDKDTKDRLLQETGWTKVLGRSAIPAVPLVLVEVHAVPTNLAIQGLEAKQTIDNIIK
jgi:hypothetical protein